MISGSQGLAESFFKVFQAKGHQLSILVRRDEAFSSLRALYPNAHLFHGDLTNKKDCANWIESTIERFGNIDLLINNAAIQGPGGKLHTLDFLELEKTVETDLMAQLFMCHQVLKIFEKNKSGTIINLSGGGATHVRPYFLPYAISKAGIVRATETLALEYPHLRFYAIAPGSLNTQMMREIAKYPPEIIGQESLDARKVIEKGGKDPMKAAELVLWLFENQPERLNGKVVSAVWDKYRETDALNPYRYWWTLRRVDEKLIEELGDLL